MGKAHGNLEIRRVLKFNIRKKVVEAKHEELGLLAGVERISMREKDLELVLELFDRTLMSQPGQFAHRVAPDGRAEMEVAELL